MRRAGKTNKHGAKAPSLADLPISKLEERTRQRAYELYETRGRGGGQELDDWLKAESELRGQKARASAVKG